MHLSSILLVLVVFLGFSSCYPLFTAPEVVLNISGSSVLLYEYSGCFNLYTCGLDSNSLPHIQNFPFSPSCVGSSLSPTAAPTEDPILNPGEYVAVPGTACTIAIWESEGGREVSIVGRATVNVTGDSCLRDKSLFISEIRAPVSQYYKGEFGVPLSRAVTSFVDWTSGYLISGLIYGGSVDTVNTCSDDVIEFRLPYKRAAPSAPYRLYFTTSPAFQFSNPTPAPAYWDGNAYFFNTVYEPIFNDTTDLKGLADGTILRGDFNHDGREDVFLCGTVFNSNSNQDEPYTAIWLNQVNYGNNPPEYALSGISNFIQVSHCVVTFADLNNDSYGDFFISGTTGSAVSCAIYLYDTTGGLYLRSDATLGEIQCVAHGAAAVGYFSASPYPELIVMGDRSTTALNGVPQDASTRIYSSASLNSDPLSSSRTYQFFDSLLPLHGPGSVFAFRGDIDHPSYDELVLSGEYSDGNGNPVRGTYYYRTSVNAGTTSTASTYATSTTALSVANAVQAAAGQQASSLSALAAAGLLDSTTAALSTSLSTAAASGLAAAAALSALTSTGTTSTATSSTFAVTSSTASVSSTTSTTRTSAVTSAATSFATSVNEVASSLTSAAASASAATAGSAFVPVSNELQAVVIPPVAVAVDTQQGSLSVSPLFDEAGADLPRVQYQVRAVKFTEFDVQTLEVASCPSPVGAFTTTTSSGKAPGGGTTAVTVFTALLCNNARFEVRYTQYYASDTITFAGIKIGVQPQSVKVVYGVSNWPFAKHSNTLEVQFEMIVNQSSQPVSVSIIPKGDSLLLWNIKLNAQAYISSLILRMGLVDNAPTPLDIYPGENNFFQINVRSPYFARSLSIDPNFDVLLDDRSSKKKSGNGAKIGAGVGVGVAVLVVAGVIIGVLLFKKKKTASFGSSGSGSGGQA